MKLLSCFLSGLVALLMTIIFSLIFCINRIEGTIILYGTWILVNQLTGLKEKNES